MGVPDGGKLDFLPAGEVVVDFFAFTLDFAFQFARHSAYIEFAFFTDFFQFLQLFIKCL